MREYITRVLELVKPYRFRFVLGLLCGFLSGLLAFTLPVAVTLAVNTVFPEAKAEKKAGKKNDAAGTNSVAAATDITTNQVSGPTTTSSTGSLQLPKPD